MPGRSTILLLKCQVASALFYYQKALDSGSSVLDEYQRERILVRMAEVHYDLEQNETAIKYFKDALSLQLKLRDDYGLALSHGGLGNLLVELGENAQAKYYLEQAYEYQQCIGDHDRLWRTCLSMTRILIAEGTFEQAFQYWNQARVLLIEQNRFKEMIYRKQQQVLELTHKFIDFYRVQGNSERLSILYDDLKYISEFLLFSEVFDEVEMVKLQVELGEHFIESHQWDEAVSAFSKIIKYTNTPTILAEVYERLGDIYMEYEPIVLDGLVDEELSKPRNISEQYYQITQGFFCNFSGNLLGKELKCGCG